MALNGQATGRADARPVALLEGVAIRGQACSALADSGAGAATASGSGGVGSVGVGAAGAGLLSGAVTGVLAGFAARAVLRAFLAGVDTRARAGAACGVALFLVEAFVLALTAGFRFAVFLAAGVTARLALVREEADVLLDFFFVAMSGGAPKTGRSD